jgi:Bacteriophage related domain of unknown function
VSFLSEQSAIETLFALSWTATPIAEDNTDFNPSALTEWVRIVVLNADGQVASLGDDPLIRYRGIVVVQIFVKSGTGWGRSMTLADLVTPIFKNVRLGSIQLGVPSPNRVGPSGGWYQVNVDCPYYREEF